jgi:hypothetical protein
MHFSISDFFSLLTLEPIQESAKRYYQKQSTDSM